MSDSNDQRPTMEEAANFIKMGAENLPPPFKIFFEGMNRHYEAEVRKSFWYKFLMFSKRMGVLSQVLFIWDVFKTIKKTIFKDV